MTVEETESEESVNITAIISDDGESGGDLVINPAKKTLLGYLYNLFIFSLITWTCIYAIATVAKTRNVIDLLRSTFQLLLSIQYIIGILYFRKAIFYERLSKHTDIIKDVNIAFASLIIFSFLISLACVILVVCGQAMFINSASFSSS